MKRCLFVIIWLWAVSSVEGAHFTYYAGGLRAFYEVDVEDQYLHDGPHSYACDDTTLATVERHAAVAQAYSYVHNDIRSDTRSNSICIRSVSVAEGGADVSTAYTWGWGFGRTQNSQTYGIFYQIMPDANEQVGDAVMVYYSDWLNASATGKTNVYFGGPWGTEHLAITRGQLPPVLKEPEAANEVLTFPNVTLSNTGGQLFNGIHSFAARIGDVIGIFAENYTDVFGDGPVSGVVASELTMILTVKPVLAGDVDFDGDVDFHDFVGLADNWLVGVGGAGPDSEPPTPDPMQWAAGGEPREIHLPPYDQWSYGVTMMAAVATDASGSVEYKFECITDGRYSSGGEGDPGGSEWRTDRTYTVLVGRSGQGHCFHIKARDLYGNETQWSATACSPLP